MKYIKTYENLKTPKPNDWVVYKIYTFELATLDDLRIGKVMSVNPELSINTSSIFDDPSLKVFSVFNDKDEQLYTVADYQIEFISSNKEDCLAYIEALKYNL